jgi:thioredoxin-dependent peroxiredoxin
VILGASFDTPAENQAFAKKFDFPYPLLCDTERKLGLAYGAADDAKSEYAKRIAYVIGPDGKVKLAFPKVEAKSFPQTLLSQL